MTGHQGAVLLAWGGDAYRGVPAIGPIHPLMFLKDDWLLLVVECSAAVPHGRVV